MNKYSPYQPNEENIYLDEIIPGTLLYDLVLLRLAVLNLFRETGVDNLLLKSTRFLLSLSKNVKIA